MKLKETEKSELERMTLNKSENNAYEDKLMGRSIINRASKGPGWSNIKDKAQTSITLEKAESYEEAFAKIEAATGIHDIDILVKNFI